MLSAFSDHLVNNISTTCRQKQKKHHQRQHHHHQQHITVVILNIIIIIPSLPPSLPGIEKGNGHKGEGVLGPVSLNSGGSKLGARR